MTSRYLNLLFSDEVKAAQERYGRRLAYAQRDGEAAADRLTENEVAFIIARDSFYMATMGAGGWPYIQHRGGPPGFVKVLNDRTLAIPDYRGNRQYVSVGNAAANNRTSLFFMDYQRRARLKVAARMTIVEPGENPKLDTAVAEQTYKARIERSLVFEIEAFDWNCPQHITPRYTLAEIEPAIGALKARIAALEAELAAKG
jgi:predicted pyridoxine 5'-phosphate oxidase superfamily flavin-nucleotide-binding protein